MQRPDGSYFMRGDHERYVDPRNPTTNYILGRRCHGARAGFVLNRVRSPLGLAALPAIIVFWWFWPSASTMKKTTKKRWLPKNPSQNSVPAPLNGRREPRENGPRDRR